MRTNLYIKKSVEEDAKPLIKKRLLASFVEFSLKDHKHVSRFFKSLNPKSE